MSKQNVALSLDIDGVWTPVPARTGATIAVDRGRGDERSRVAYGRCPVTLDNAAGDFSFRNPTGQHYGKIGRNTPLRLALNTPVQDVADTFSRSVSDAWGSADSGQGYTVVWTSGSAADFDVAGGEGTQVVSTAGSYRLAYLAGLSAVDGDAVLGPINLPAIAAPASGSLEPGNIAVRVRSATSYYLFRIEWTTANSILAQIFAPGGGTALVSVTVFTSGQWTAAEDLMARARWSGEHFQFRVWQADQAEPSTWHAQAYDAAYLGPGGVGVRSGAAGGNTNVPVTFGYGAFTVDADIVLMVGEVSQWVPRWNIVGSDITTPIEAAGILRRLNQGAKLPRSALYRAIVRSGAVLYWPLEEGLAADQAVAAVGGNPLTVTFSSGPGDFPFGAEGPPGGGTTVDTTGDGSTVMGLSALVTSPLGPGHNQWMFQAVLREELSSTPAAVTPLHLNTTDGIRWFPRLLASGNFGLRIFDLIAFVEITTLDSGISLLDSIWHHTAVYVRQAGADLAVKLYLDGVEVASTTLVGRTIGAFTSVHVEVPNGPRVGHVYLTESASTTHGALAVDPVHVDAIYGHAGETASERITRLCVEEGVPLALVSGASTGALMGPQVTDTFVNLLEHAAAADRGVLAEMRGALGLKYRSLDSLQNQTPVGLNYVMGHIAPLLDPVDDDQVIHNDVTATRPFGSSARVVQETGPLSIAPPPDGVGTYDRGAVEVHVQTDAQLVDVAGWLRHLGTWDEARWPSVTVNLAAPVWAAVPGLVAAVLALDTGDLIRINDLPEWTQPDPIVAMVQGYRLTLESHVLQVTWIVTPGRPYTVTLLDDAARARLDTAGATLASAIDSDDTVLSVATTSGPLWTTASGDRPFDIIIGGERMTVTNLTGAASPQTVTVTRSVNGVVKPHASGAVVNVAEPTVLAL